MVSGFSALIRSASSKLARRFELAPLALHKGDCLDRPSCRNRFKDHRRFELAPLFRPLERKATDDHDR
jgi:hypothetical protein